MCALGCTLLPADYCCCYSSCCQQVSALAQSNSSNLGKSHNAVNPSTLATLRQSIASTLVDLQHPASTALHMHKLSNDNCCTIAASACTQCALTDTVHF